MPNPKISRLTFVAQGRTRRLYRKHPTGPFYVRFQVRGKDQPRCLGTTDDRVAKEKARLIIDAAYLGNAEESRRLKMRSDYSPLPAVCDVYRERFGTTAKRKRTAQTNIGALTAIVEASGAKMEEARANVLTGALIRMFEAVHEKRIERDAGDNMKQGSELQVRSYIYSRVKQARSMFKKSRMDWFEHLVLPDLGTFRAQGVTPPKRPAPRPLDAGVIEALYADAPRLRRENRALYVTFLFFSQLGLRNGEIKEAKRTWLKRREDGSGELGVIYRPEENYEPKAKTEGWVPINAQVLADLEEFAMPEEEGGYLVPAPNKTERAKIVDREHSAWAGQWIKGRSKVSYELRRHAGSLYYQQYPDLAKVQKFLRHADLKTTMDWYWYLLEKLEPMSTPAWLRTAPQLSIVEAA